MDEQGIRLNKFIADAGICSRRKADELIRTGEIFLNGEPAQMGAKVMPEDKIIYQEKEIHRISSDVLLLFNKPCGIVCTTEKREKQNIIDYIQYPLRIYPLGRLDKDSRGLILLTNRGDFFNDIMKARNLHEKEYEVEVDHLLTADFLHQMSAGVYLEELQVVTRPCVVRKTDATHFTIILTQGLNRQIRRMCEALGYHVRDLKRVRIMNLVLGDLEEGSYREITSEEQIQLEEMIGKKLWK